MPHIVHKYFDDMYKVAGVVFKIIRANARLLLIVGDSLIADVCNAYRFIISQNWNKNSGLTIEKVEKARNRRSGQVRNYRLRRTIITLKKESKAYKTNGRYKFGYHQRRRKTVME